MNQLSTLVLVDTDPRRLETLTYGFEREGCTVAGTSDPRLAADLVRTTSPQLAVVSLRGPGPEDIEIIAGLRSSVNGRNLPVVTLGPVELRPAALAAGATDFLPTPLFLRDVISVSRLLTFKEQVAAPDAEAVVSIEGRLSEYYGLFYLLRAMAVTGRSGILALGHGNRKAELRFSDGAVMAAHVAALQGLPAVHHLLLWEEAALSLKFRPVPKRTQIHLGARELLDECERFLRDFAFSARDLGPPRVVYAVDAQNEGRSAGLQPNQVGPVLRLFDGHRTLAEVIEESPFRVFDTLRVIKRLLDAGALAPRPGSKSLAESGPRSMMEQWALVPDPRAVDRRKSSRRLKPVPATGSAPIPLTVKKTTMAGEIPMRKPLPRTPARGTEELGEASTVQVHLDAAGTPLTPPVAPARSAPLIVKEPAPTAPIWGSPFAPAPDFSQSVTPGLDLVPVTVPAPAAALAVAAAVAPAAPPVAPPSRVARAGELSAPSPARQAAHDPVVGPSLALPEPPPSVVVQPAEALPPEAPPPEPPAATLAPTMEAPPVAALALPPEAEAPPPVLAPNPPRSDSKTRLKKVGGTTRITPSTAFDAVEADFFAREADLYKHEAVESFDDLDRGNTDPALRIAATEAANKKKP
jgi:CheY-like chemotaxis protein